MQPTPATPTPTPTSDILDTAANTVQPWVPAIVAVLVLVLAVAIATPWLIGRYIIWKEANNYTRLEAFCAPFKAIYRRIYKLIKKQEAPRPWRLTQPRDLLKKKEDLMNHQDIRDALTSKDEERLWVTDRGTYQKNVYGKNDKGEPVITGTETAYNRHYFDFKAWLSPYPGTVRLLNKLRPSYNPKTQRYQPREWVRIMANRLIIREASPKESLGLVQPKHGREFFVIELYADHSTPDKMRKLAEPIKTALKLGDLREIDKGNPRRVTWLATMPGVKTPLANEYMPSGVDFITKHPATHDLKKVPLAVTDRGDVWGIRPLHTLIVGVTGSGKSSPLNTLTAQLSDAVLAGTCTITALDPKANGDLRTKWGKSAIYTACGTDPDQYVKLINGFYESMQEQGKLLSQDTGDGSSFTAADIDFSDFHASTKTPLRILMIDELPAVIDDLKKHPEGKGTLTNLNRILREGRSLGHIVVAASQTLEKATLDIIARENFVYKVALRIESEYQNGIMLGTEAAANGFNACDIPKDPEFIGVAYVKDDTGGDPLRVRFPFFSNAQIADIMNKHPKTGAVPTVSGTAPEQAHVAPEALEFDLDDLDDDPDELDAIDTL
jgi:hypothetical protein